MSSKLYVGNLPFSFNETDLSELFEQFGAVESAKIIVDPHSSRSKGFGFVELPGDEEAEKAIEALDGSEVSGRNVRVSKAHNKPAGGGDRGGRGGGYGGGGDRGGRGGGYGGGDRGGGGGYGGGGDRGGGGNRW